MHANRRCCSLLLLYASQNAPLQTLTADPQHPSYAVIPRSCCFTPTIRRAPRIWASAPFFRYFARSEQVSETIEEIVTRDLRAKADVARSHRVRAGDRPAQLRR